MKTLLFFLLFISTPVLADPFNIQLPLNSQYAPVSLGYFEKAFVVGYEQGGENFQLQFAPVTGDEKFNDVESDHDLLLGFKIGLGKGFEFEIDSTSSVGYSSIKYSFESVGSNLKHSLLFGKLASSKWGHGGQYLEGDDDCGFLDLGCWLSDIFNIFGSSSGSFEYNYEVDVDASMLAYLQGYQYSPGVMPYWGVYYIDYDISYRVIDNTGAGAHQNGHVETDLMYLTLGARFNSGKPDSKGKQSVWLVNYMVYKDSDSHDGDLNGELRLSYIKRF